MHVEGRRKKLEDSMKKSVLSFPNVLATAGMLFAGYVFFASLPDIRRYIRISTM